MKQILFGLKPLFEDRTASKRRGPSFFDLTRVAGLSVLAGILALPAYATDPEIMVHENDLAEKGEVVATLHSNYTLRGSKESGNSTWPDYRQLNLMAEFATGLAPGWEAGLHLPIRRAGVDSPSSREGEWGSSGAMLRLKHITSLENGFFVGFNAEYDFFAKRFEPNSRGVEFRGIIGHDTDDYRVTLNPTWNWGFGSGSETHVPEFSLNGKALYKVNEKVAFGVETYTLWGSTTDLSAGKGERYVYLVGELDLGHDQTLHLGVGQGYKDAPAKSILKAVWSTSF